MAEVKEESPKSFDPFEKFRGLRDAYLDAMSKAMIEAVNTESYAQSTGAMLDAYLSAASPVREAMEKTMVQALAQLSLPSRQELAALAERFTNIEMRVDDLDAKLDRVLSAVAGLKQPPAGRKPPGRESPAARRRPNGSHANG